MVEVRLKDIALAMGLITGFVFIISLAVFYTYNLLHSGDFCSCTEQIPILIIIVASSGLFVGSFAYYFLIDKIIRNYKAKKDLKRSLTPFLRLLNKDEEKVVMLLLEKRKLNQADISKRAGLSRVKTTRILQKLEDKELIKREKRGKINLVMLSEQVMKIIE
ncbi:MAG: MarR family transcriptional regulator [Candidatus Diapherotrites archaeon]|nr:MarR family transcriptional regulator [Candidatus Diapherotrites archaeon]